MPGGNKNLKTHMNQINKLSLIYSRFSQFDFKTN